MANQESSVSITLKLLVDTRAKRVIFAETGKDFVDFLFRILSLPVATVIGLIKNPEIAGSLSNLYRSVVNLNDSYMQPNTKDALLKPVSRASSSVPLLALAAAPAPPAKMFYECPTSHFINYVTNDPRASCPCCDKQMTRTVTYVAGPGRLAEKAKEEAGFVKEAVTYMVTDDLVVTPLSTTSSIALLNKFEVKEIGLLEEKAVNFGMDEAVKLLDASLRLKNVLTEVFLTRE